MRIVLINRSDTVGGAAVASRRLMQALRRAGHDARLLVADKNSDDPYVAQVGWRPRLKTNFYAERLAIYGLKRLKRENLFKVSIANTGTPLHRHPWVQQADIVVLNWISQGMLSLRQIQQIALAKPTVWVMHDMWCMTGICHHPCSCDRYLDRCGKCPFLNKRRFRDLSHAGWTHKQKMYERARIQFVAVSNWQRTHAANSSLLGHNNIPVIPNAFALDEYPLEPIFTREQLDLPRTDATPIITMGAARLDDSLKGLDIAIEALNLLANRGVHAHVALYGDIKDASALEQLTMPYTFYGPISDGASVQSLYGHSTVALSTSLYETQGLTLIEGMAFGATPVTFAQDGRADFVIDGKTGYTARYRDPVAVARAIEQALKNPFDRQAQRQFIADHFDAPIVAQAHIDLYQQMLGKNKKN